MFAVYESSRFSRNEKNRLRAESIFEKHNIKFFSLLDCVPDDADDAFLFKGFNGLFNESFSRKNSKRSALKLFDVSKASFFTGGPIPFGYKSIPGPNANCSKQRKVLAINPEEEKIVELIFSLAIRGVFGTSYGVKKISTYLNDNGIFRRNRNWTLPLMNFGKQQIINFSDACNETILGGNIDATKTLLMAVIDEIVVEPSDITLKGRKLQLLRNIAKNKAGNQDLVPSLITNWRREWDSNPR